MTDPGAELQFSQDSVWFDTIFTSIGSTTKYFRVKNPYNQPIKISRIYLGRGMSSKYRLNVDGLPGKDFYDIEIPPKDSLYVFVEVTIDPTAGNTPFLYKDSILFEVNSKRQDIDLVAFGQDAYYHFPNKKIYFSNGGVFNYGIEPCPSNLWKADKPHLVYGYAVIDSACTLTVEKGAKIYLHQNAGIWVYRYGTIKVMGEKDFPVEFRGDRLEPEYNDIPGQWDRIWINEGSTSNEINYAIIKNGFIGIHAGYSVLDGLNLPFANGNDPKLLKINNTKVQNCSYLGLYGNFYNIQGGNNVFMNTGDYMLALVNGGSYSFRHCTFGNFWNKDTRSNPILLLNNYNQVQEFPMDSAYFGNCILYGSLNDEIKFDTTTVPGKFNNVVFHHCLLKTQLNTSNTNRYIGCKINQNPSFINPGAYNFDVNPVSPAINAGSALFVPKWPLDIEGTPRSSTTPTIGAYENF